MIDMDNLKDLTESELKYKLEIEDRKINCNFEHIAEIKKWLAQFMRSNNECRMRKQVLRGELKKRGVKL